MRRIGPLCAIAAFALLSVSPNGPAAQGTIDPPVLAPGLHELTLARAGEPAIGYAISIPSTRGPCDLGSIELRQSGCPTLLSRTALLLAGPATQPLG
jgi:hypothetical protein